MALFVVMLAVRARKLFSALSAIFGLWVVTSYIKKLPADSDSAHALKEEASERKTKMADDDGAGKTQYFPEGSMLNTLIISIVDFEKRFTDILKEPYIVYLIETK